ncbi:MAG: hypothetical protein P8179_23555 [Candidatus Thiodiazotropha sp.]
MSRKDKLSQYLRDGHQIILIDDFFVETFKANADNSVRIFQRNVELLKEYPSSIFYGKNRSELVRLEELKKAPLTTADLLCEKETRKIRRLISLDSQQLELELPLFKSESKKRVSESNDFAEEFIRGLSRKADVPDNKKYKRSDELLELHICEVAMSVLGKRLKDMYGESLSIEKFKSKKSVLYFQNYILLWRALDWALKKGYENSKNLPNDNFDLKYVLTSCFFDGLLTKEKWMIDCRNSALSSVKYMISCSAASNPSVAES